MVNFFKIMGSKSVAIIPPRQKVIDTPKISERPGKRSCTNTGTSVVYENPVAMIINDVINILEACILFLKYSHTTVNENPLLALFASPTVLKVNGIHNRTKNEVTH